jgi:hypothetical protein
VNILLVRYSAAATGVVSMLLLVATGATWETVLAMALVVAVALVLVALPIASAGQLAIATLVAVMILRPAGLLAGAGSIGYVHYLPALGGFVLLVRQRTEGTADASLIWGLAGLGIVSLASTLAGGAGPLPTAGVYLTYVEPFLLAALCLGASPRTRRWMTGGLIWFAVIQVPMALAQAARHGVGDDVVGTLGSGRAHDLAGIMVVGAALILARGRLRNWAPVLVLMLIVPFLSDAKQIIAVLFVAILAGVVMQFRVRPILRARQCVWPSQSAWSSPPSTMCCSST